MSLAPRTRLGPYEVLALLGAGGMGEVYRARDTRLGRDVALKILPGAVAKDPDRIARFTREAQVLASLNHPHIAAIYGVEESVDTRALVMELVDGPTIADRIAHGRIPIDEALPIARQIVAALDVAHEAGIIHRDLKPANIKLRTDGTVKVLDFGLARALDPAGASVVRGESATMTSPAMTQAGVILGTAAYMSPEQARGKPVNKRADVWAFGCVLYEMLTGRAAFAGDTVTDVLSAVVRVEPDWAAIPADTPPAVLRLLRRSLQKDPADRLRDIGDAAFELNEADPKTSGPESRARVAIALAVIALAALIAAAWATVQFRRTGAPQPAIQFTLSQAANVDWGFPAISPDGRHLAVVGGTADGRRRIWIRSLDTVTTRELAGTEAAERMFWSPDSTSIAFFARGKINRVRLDGASVDIVCELGTTGLSTGEGETWGRQGTILYASGGQLWTVPASGGQSSALIVSDHGKPIVQARWPSFFPDGRQFIFVANGTIWIAALDKPDATEILKANSKAVYGSGSLLFSRNGMLQTQPFDVDSRRLTGPASSLGPLNVMGPFGDVPLSVSDDGVLVFRNSPQEQDLVWWERSKRSGTLAASGRFLNPALSPDGNRAAVAIADAVGRYDIWVYDTKRGTSSRLTSTPEDEWLPTWSPDGRYIAYTGGPTINENLYRIRADGAGSAEALSVKPTGGPYILNQWSQDGRYLWWTDTTGLVYAPVDRIGSAVTYLATSAAGRPVQATAPTAVSMTSPRLSPDGKWVAYVATESGRPEVYVRPFPDANAGRWQISYDGGIEPRWRGDGRELFYRHNATEVELRATSIVAGRTGIEVGETRTLFRTMMSRGYTTYDVTPDGQRFLVNTTFRSGSDPVTVVVNWPALKK